MVIIGIDPGNIQSAFCAIRVLDDGAVTIPDKGIMQNAHVCDWIQSLSGMDWIDSFVIEKVCSFGRAVGREVMDTAMWAGVFAGRYSGPARIFLVPRAKVRFHLGRKKTANDKDIRAALIERAPWMKKDLSRDLWSAAAVAITLYDLKRIGGDLYYELKFSDKD